MFIGLSVADNIALRSCAISADIITPFKRVDFWATSDTGLVLAVARRNERALAEIYRRHGGAVASLAWKVIGSNALADDIIVGVFVHLWGDPECFDSARGSLRTLLLTEVHGRAVDAVHLGPPTRRGNGNRNGDGTRSSQSRAAEGPHYTRAVLSSGPISGDTSTNLEIESSAALPDTGSTLGVRSPHRSRNQSAIRCFACGQSLPLPK